MNVTSKEQPLSNPTEDAFDISWRVAGDWAERQEVEGWNAYAYANGNPVTLTDPSGHMAIGAAAGIPVRADRAAVIGELIAWAFANPLILLAAALLVVAVIVILLILTHVEWQQAARHFAGRAAGAAAGAAGDALNRIMGGAGALPELPGQVKDKIKEVIDKALGKAAETIIIGAAIVVAAGIAIDKIPRISNLCQEIYKGLGFTGINEPHIAERHGPGSPFNPAKPNGEFNIVAWKSLYQLAEYTLERPSIPPYLQPNGRCVFQVVDIGFFTGWQSDGRDTPSRGVTVVYDAFMPPLGWVWTMYPYEP